MNIIHNKKCSKVHLLAVKALKLCVYDKLRTASPDTSITSTLTHTPVFMLRLTGADDRSVYKKSAQHLVSDEEDREREGQQV